MGKISCLFIQTAPCCSQILQLPGPMSDHPLGLAAVRLSSEVTTLHDTRAVACSL